MAWVGVLGVGNVAVSVWVGGARVTGYALPAPVALALDVLVAEMVHGEAVET